MNGAETCRSGIDILNILFTLHMHFVGVKSFCTLHQFNKFMLTCVCVIQLSVCYTAVSMLYSCQYVIHYSIQWLDHWQMTNCKTYHRRPWPITVWGMFERPTRCTLFK
jgi:hypothetical protein